MMDPMTPAEFLAFCDELAKRGPLSSVDALGYSVRFQPPADTSMADMAKSFLPLFQKALGGREPFTPVSSHGPGDD